MMPEAAIALACRSAISVSCGSVLTAERPCSRRYCETVAAMSSACASVAATTRPTTKPMTFMTAFGLRTARRLLSVASFGFRRGRGFRAVADNEQNRLLVLRAVEVNLLAVVRHECSGRHR